MMDKSTLDAITAFGSIGVMIATFILAMFTAWLAFTTREMARSTTRLTQQENQQHVDNLRPICVLEPNGFRLKNQNFLVKDPNSTPIKFVCNFERYHLQQRYGAGDSNKNRTQGFG